MKYKEMTKAKRIFASILLIGMFLSLIPFGSLKVNAETLEGSDQGFTCKIIDGEVCVTGVTSTVEETVVIPSTLCGYPVTGIGVRAFWRCENLSSVTIPCGVEYIDMEAFGYTSLTNVTLPEGLKSIGYGAFYSCDNLQNISIPDSVEHIGSLAFECCGALTSINIPSSVVEIGDIILNGCESIQYISIPFFGFEKDNAKTAKLSYLFSSIEDNSEIPATLKRVELTNTEYIGDFAFAGCHYIEQIVLPEGVKSIGEGAFDSCVALEKLVLPQSITAIGQEAFKLCDFTSINIPSSIKSIADKSFYRCDELSEFYFCGIEEQWNEIEVGSDNESLTSLELKYHKWGEWQTDVANEYRICEFCKRQNYLTGLTIKQMPNKVEYEIEENLDTAGLILTLTNNDGSTEEITAGFTVEGFDPYCVGTQTIKISYAGYSISYKVVVSGGVEPTWKFDEDTGTLTIFGDGNMLNWSFDNRPWYSFCSKIEKVVIKEGITSIGSCAFADCDILTSVEVPNSVTDIYHHAFAYCTSLKSLTIPQGVIKIDDYSFILCESLESIIISDSVESIGTDVFYWCGEFTDVYYGGTPEQWNAIVIDYAGGFNNEELANATIHYTKTYDITYDANGGTNAPSAQVKNYGTTITLSDTVPTYSDFDFLGWATTADGDVEYLPGEIYSENADITLFAVWGEHVHSYSSVVTSPTCTEGGYTTHTCSVCGDSYTDSEVDALGHTPGDEATCTEDQTCTVCGETIVPALGHTEGEWVTLEDGSQELRCTICGELIDIIPPGDVNADGVIDKFDYLFLKNFYFGKCNFREDEAKRADVNGDGNIDMFDYMAIKRYIIDN